MRLRPSKPDRGIDHHDLDAVTDRYLRRFDPLIPPFDETWPRDSFHWANTRAGIASRRVGHGFRNAGLSMHRLGRVTDRATQAVRDFADGLRRGE